MRIAVTVCFMLTVVSVAFGQDAPPPMPRIAGGAYRPHPPPPRPATPYATSQPKRSEPVPATAFGATDRLEHLLQAAVHLEVAGELDQARQVRRLVAQERHSLLSRLGKQNADAGPRQVKVQFRAMEISINRLRELGIEWKHATPTGEEVVTLGKDHPTFGSNRIYDDNTALVAMTETLREEGAARVLAEPTIIATSGRPATFQSGGKITREQADGSERLVDVGTRIDIVPEVAEPDRIHLQLKIAISEPCPGLSRPSVRRVDTGMEMKSGQTHVIGGLLQRSEDRDEIVEMVILVTSEIVDSSLTADAAPAAGAVK
jgi:type II secretory pathway component HofQ